MYLVVEVFPSPECAELVRNENGTVKVFDDIADAVQEAKTCQNARIVNIGQRT